MQIKDLLGTTANAFLLAADEDNNASNITRAISSAFFKPYKSPSNVLFRTTSIITDPLLFTAGTAFFVLSAAFDLLKTFASLFTLNLTGAKENIGECGDSLKGVCFMLVAAIVSPVINLVDLIGSGVASLKQNSVEEEEVHQSPSMQYN